MGQAASGETRRHAAIEPEHPGRGQHAKQAGETHDEGGGELVQRSQVQGMEELRTALESDRVDEQCEEYVFDAAIDVDAELSNDDADQQCAGDATKNEAADPEFPDQVAKRDGYEERE